jgi:hypothetical protein
MACRNRERGEAARKGIIEKSGLGKFRTLAALFLSHFGQFDRTTLPASWESTDNALERRLFTLKDTLCVIDDYAPKADVYAQRQLVQRATLDRAAGKLDVALNLAGIAASIFAFSSSLNA